MAEEKRYIVVRRISGVTKNKELWQPLSRPLLEQDAKDFKENQEEDYKKKGRRAFNAWNNIFLVEVVKEG